MTAQPPEAIRDAALAVSEHYEGDVFFSGPIDDAGYATLAEAITQARRGSRKNKALLILVTNGGLANPAYQIARLFQNPPFPENV